MAINQVTASSWLNDLRDQVEHTRVLNVVYRSATALGSRLPSIASAKARVAGAGALLRPVSSGTQVTFVCSYCELMFHRGIDWIASLLSLGGSNIRIWLRFLCT